MKAFLDDARAIFEGRASFGESRGTASQHYRRFAKLGVPGFVLQEDVPDRPEVDEFGHLLVWYQDIRNREQRGQKWEPIRLEAILAYEHFLAKIGEEMGAFEWEMMFRIDAEWVKSIPKTAEEVKAEQLAAKQTRH